MKTKKEILGIIAMVAIAIALIAYMNSTMDKSDYDIRVEENEYWCDSVSNGFYHASQETYVKRCGE